MLYPLNKMPENESKSVSNPIKRSILNDLTKLIGLESEIGHYTHDQQQTGLEKA